MKKLSIVTMLTLGLSVPLSAMADDDVTIRVMEMHEMSADAVMQHIELPETASDQAAEHAQGLNRARERVREHAGEGEEYMMQSGEMMQEREMEQEHERMMEDRHEHTRQTEETDIVESPMMDGGQTGMGGHN